MDDAIKALEAAGIDISAIKGALKMYMEDESSQTRPAKVSAEASKKGKQAEVSISSTQCSLSKSLSRRPRVPKQVAPVLRMGRKLQTTTSSIREFLAPFIAPFRV